MHALFYHSCSTARYGSGIADVPPPDWCITTLRSLTTKYEHLADSRKVKPPFAEAVLNSFKSKLLNLVSSQSLYDPEDISDCEPEWPLASECSAPFIDLKPADCVYDGGALATTGNYLTISPADIVDSPGSHCVVEESNMGTGLVSASLSSTSPIGTSSYLESDSLDTTPAQHADDSSDLLVTFPPSIEEALRRFLADSSDQLLSETFTTFADAECSSSTGATLSIDSPVAAATTIACQDAESDDDQGQFMSESGSCSPESISSPEATLEFLTAADPADLFGKSPVTSDNPASWDPSVYSQSVEAAAVASDVALDCSSVAEDEEDDESELPPCKRKRRGETESKDAKAILRNSLPISPRKRSRSISRRRDAAAAVPLSLPSGAESPPPLLNLCISSTADSSSTEA
ncbi:hypothetical protein H4S04_002258 [Coemansia sp. S16]|nr:hypothetical protein H4S03_002573 [Coemansia sp. S3946]KAJ2051005.1 hypothetical protein H4S04_002258 [Coemansia sp. S16]KAJ2334322.1 hypothetical protein GGH92_008356 [Coemansia sp. RSA 2673]